MASRLSVHCFTDKSMEKESREHFYSLPEPRRSTIIPKPPVHVEDPQAVLNRQIIRKEPSLNHLEARKRMYFPGWYALSPSSRQTQPSPSLHTTSMPMRINAFASASSRPSLASLPSGGRENESRERLHKLPELQHSTIIPKPPVHIKDSQAELNRHVVRKEPSLNHQKTHGKVIFSKSSAPSPLSLKTQPLQKRYEYVPPLQTTAKNVESTQTVPSRPLSIRSGGQLHSFSKFQKFEDTKDEYFFISDGALVSVSENKYELIPLHRWEKEYESHCKMMRIPFFANFKKWKPFYIWRSKVRAKKIHMARNAIKNNLFMVNQFLSPALIEIRKMCCQISDTCLFRLENKHTYTLQEFQDTQFKQLQEAQNDLKELKDLVKEVTICACNSALEPQFVLDKDSNQEGIVISRIDKAILYNRLLCFIRLVDYLVGSTLHSLVVNAVGTLLALLQHKIGQMPSNANIQSWNRLSLNSTHHSDEESESLCQVRPMLISELMLDTNALIYKPSEEKFQEAISEIIELLKKTVMSFNTLTEDPDIKFVTESMHITETECFAKIPPKLKFILESDSHLQSIIKNIKATFQIAFDAAKAYSLRLEPLRISYKKNVGVDLDAIRQQDHGLPFFEKVLESYHSGHEEAGAIQPRMHVGLLLVDQTQFKEKLVSSFLYCLEVINEMLPQLARKKLDTLIAESCEAQLQLEFPASTTTELADSLIFLDEMQEKITGIEQEQETVCQMYNLVNIYSIPTPPEDLAVFGMLQSHIDSLYNIIDKAVAERDVNMEKFSTSLSKDIKELNNEVMNIYLKLQDPQILDINADSSQVHVLLEETQLSIDGMQARVSTYTFYQKRFKLEVTKFKYLEDLIAEYKLKQLLWDSTEKWDILQDQWEKSTLTQLELEQFSSVVNQYSSYVNQLEEGLPSNNVVTCLKEKVEGMKQRVPVIADLQSLCMKAEQWKTLQPILGTYLNGNELTGALLENLNVFSHGTEIHEISKQASEKESLEAIFSEIFEDNNDLEESIDDMTALMPMTET